MQIQKSPFRLHPKEALKKAAVGPRIGITACRTWNIWQARISRLPREWSPGGAEGLPSAPPGNLAGSLIGVLTEGQK